MNPHIKRLHPYPFEKLATLKQGIIPPESKPHIAFSIGEPKHPTPHFIHEAVLTHLHALGNYPGTRGIMELRQAISRWIAQRFKIEVNCINPENQVLPVSGTREALFSFAQCIIDQAAKPLVIMPNPFYQIYEGAAILAGAEPYYLNTLAETDYLPDFDRVPDTVWRRCQLLYICSPGNPSGMVIGQSDHEKLINLAEKFDFVIAADECYSEIYTDEQKPPQGLLQSAYAMGNTSFERCVVFHSLSKRSNAPGLRSGFVAGDAGILDKFLQYRTYHGCALPLSTQHASIQAWNDEKHVQENRQLYRVKFAKVISILDHVYPIYRPPAGFYLWINTGTDDTEFTKRLYQQQNITVLPGSFLSRDCQGNNPGSNHIRMALVAPLEECIEGANRMNQLE